MQETMNITTEVRIDGSRGEGGGQILRTALALSAITGRPFVLENIRANRRRPGLLRQHLVCVRAMAEVCGAETSGAELESSDLAFRPNAVRGGDFRWPIGSAGSTSLVLQTVLLPLLTAATESRLTIEGGTHNGGAPSFEFLDLTFVPLLADMGFPVSLTLGKAGFYPAGGGRLEASITPPPRERERGAPLDLKDPVVTGMEVCAWSSNISERIGAAETELAGEALGIPAEHRRARMVASSGPGNVLSVIVATDRGARVFTSFGEPRRALESVVEECVAQVRRWMVSGAAVDEHLQDQLLLPLSLGKGGRFTTTALSGHTLTNMEIIQAFLPVTFAVTELGPGLWEIARN